MLVEDNVISDVTRQLYTIRLARTEKELEDAFRLRYDVFKKELGRSFLFKNGLDKDAYDDQAHHLIVVHNPSHAIVGTYRLQSYEQAESGIGFTSSSRYKINQLPESVLKNGVEVGRACIEKQHRSGRVLFLLWKGLAGYLKHFNKRYLFGIAALDSNDPKVALQTYNYLKQNGYFHPDYDIDVKGEYMIKQEPNIIGTSEINIPPLFENYLHVGTKVCGGPSYDKDLGLIYFLILLDSMSISEKTKKMFFG